MSAETPDTPVTEPAPGKTDRWVLCRRCEHLNPPERTTCEDCGSDLFLTCAHCGARLQAVLHRCPKCKHRLERSLLPGHRRRRHRHHSGLKQALLWTGRIALFALGLFVVYIFVAVVADGHLPDFLRSNHAFPQAGGLE